MNSDEYRLALLFGGSSQSSNLEQLLDDNALSSFSPEVLSLLLTRVGSQLSSDDSAHQLVRSLHAATFSPVVLKQLFRLPRNKRDSALLELGNAEFPARAKESDFSPLMNARLVHLTAHEHSSSILQPLVPQGIEMTTFSGAGLDAHRNQNKLLARYEALGREHLSALHQVLIVIADGNIERHAIALSRLSNTPLLILQLDVTPGTAGQTRVMPFVPSRENVPFPPVIWLRYALSTSRRLTAWDVSTGQELRVGLESDELANAFVGLLPRLLLLHDLRFFPALPIESRADLPNTPTRWFSHDRRHVGRYGISQGELLAALLEHYWSAPNLSETEHVAQSRLEFVAAALPFAQRSIIFDAAVMLGHESFMDQIKIRRLWIANEFESIGKFLEWTPRTLDDESRRLGAEAAAATTLEGLLREARPSSSTVNHKREHIVCVLHASAPEQSGGYAIRAHGILKHLRQEGIHVTPVTRPGFPEPLQGKTEPTCVEDITYYRLPGLRSYYHGEAQYMLESVTRYKEFFIAQEATKVHVRSTYLIAIPAMIAARQLGLKVVYEVSGLWELVYQQNESAGSLHQRAPFGEYWETLAVKFADEILTMNEPMRELLLTRGAAPDHIHLAPNAVDATLFTVRPPISKPKPVIGYIGSIVRYENLSLLVKSVSRLVSEGYDFEVQIIGDGVALPALRRQIERQGLGHIIRTLGRIPHEQVTDHYEQMDIMVYPRMSTPATDTVTPLKPFEALAMGKAVVVSDVPPLREIAGDGRRGLIFPSNSVRGLTTALRKLLDDEQLRVQLGLAARNWIEQERSWATVVDAFSDAYAKL